MATLTTAARTRNSEPKLSPRLKAAPGFWGCVRKTRSATGGRGGLRGGLRCTSSLLARSSMKAAAATRYRDAWRDTGAVVAIGSARPRGLRSDLEPSVVLLFGLAGD